ncbi:MAG: SDR family NAD(P)-dependent oxidoreductase [Lautropia sp.]
MGRMTGKVALVIGAGPNIGGTIAHRLASEGASVAICDLKAQAMAETVEFLRSRGFRASGFTADAANDEEVDRAVRSAEETFGAIDVMVNLAGRQRRFDLLDMTPEDWNEQMASFATAAAVTTKHAARAMLRGNVSGSIIHIASDAAHQGEPGNSGYSAAKAAVVNFARAAAAELACHRIRVNSISPTCMENNVFKYGRGDGVRTPRTVRIDDFYRGIPLGRLCRAIDVANAALFLASEESSFATGIDICLDGGARAKYWPWMPGDESGRSMDEYCETIARFRFGEPDAA